MNHPHGSKLVEENNWARLSRWISSDVSFWIFWEALLWDFQLM